MLEKIVKAVHKFIGELPSTNTRLLVSLVIVFGTAIKYWLSKDTVYPVEGGAPIVLRGWEPAGLWLAFLATLLGLDATQFGIKRTTEWKPTRVIQAEEKAKQDAGKDDGEK